MQSGYFDRFNGKFRIEHLNEAWFETLQQARNAAAIRRKNYNKVVRLDSSHPIGGRSNRPQEKAPRATHSVALAGKSGRTGRTAARAR